jgi:hypothetical protein
LNRGIIGEKIIIFEFNSLMNLIAIFHCAFYDEESHKLMYRKAVYSQGNLLLGMYTEKSKAGQPGTHTQQERKKNGARSSDGHERTPISTVKLPTTTGRIS